MKTIRELLENRAKCIADARAILDVSTTEKREATAEERQKFDAFMKEADELKNQADTIQADLNRSRRIEEAEANNAIPRDRIIIPTDQVKSEFKFRDGRVLDLAGNRANKEYGTAFNAYMKSGQPQNSLQADLDQKGGYTVPSMFNAQLIQDIDDLVFIRQKATKFILNTGDSLGFPSLDSDPGDAEWTAELKTGSNDDSMTFGKREFKPKPLARRIKVSRTLIRSSAIPIEQLVRSRLAYKFGITEEKSFLVGTGANQPLGLFVASDMGIPTSRDVSDGNTATSITFDGLKNVQYSLKAAYRNRAEWLFHRDAYKQISKLKDGEGRYLWQPSVQVGSPDILLGRPYNESEYVPNTFTASKYVGMFADFSYYWIVDALTMSMQVLYELYAETNQIGYIGRLECDGMPVLAEAFARVKLGA